MDKPGASASTFEIRSDPGNPLCQPLRDEAAANGDDWQPLGNMVLNIQMMPKTPKNTPLEQ
jgi:hypothetical protein